MSVSRFAFVLILPIVALTPGRSEAELIPWSYQWNAQPIVIKADPIGPNQPPGGITLTPGAITISGGNPGVALGNANIVAVNLTAFTFAPTSDGKPYHFTNSPYHLGITLTDVDSDKSGTLHFSGVFDGDFTSWKMGLGTRFTSTPQQSLILGHHLYSVTLSHFKPPDPPAEGGVGSISASVSVQPVSAPEPSALLLACSGLVGAAFSCLRRRTLP